MFFTKFFTRDHLYYLTKGEKYLQEERIADARHAFLEALDKLDESSAGGDIRDRIAEKMGETGNLLAVMNLSEAEHALGRGDAKKAEEHLNLVIELAEDPAITNKAKLMLNAQAAMDNPAETPQSAHHCSGCSSGTGTAVSEQRQSGRSSSVSPGTVRTHHSYSPRGFDGTVCFSRRAFCHCVSDDS